MQVKSNFLSANIISFILKRCFLPAAIMSLSASILAQSIDNLPVSPAVIFESLALNHDIATKASPEYRSPAALTPSNDGRFLYVAEQTAKQISVIDIVSGRVCRRIKLPNEVTGIAAAPGGRLYATCSSDQWPSGMVCEINSATGKVLRRIPAGFGARSPVISPDGKILYICNQYGNDVQSMEIAGGTVQMKLRAFHQPFSAAITPDGKILVVADCLPSEKSTNQEAAAKIFLINTAEQRTDKVISLPVGSHSVFDVTVSPDGAYAFVSHLVGIFNIQASEVEGGWVHTNNVAIIDIKNRRLLNDFPLDDPHLGAANPWEISCTADGKLMCIAHAGSNELTVIDIPKLLIIAKVKSTAITFDKGQKFIGCSHDLTALSDVKSRVPVAGYGPRAVAVIGKRAFTAGYFGDSTGGDYIEIFTLARGRNATKPAGKISLGPVQLLNGTRKGEQAFYNGKLCYQSWQSCSSCHPFARSDGLNWILGRDPANTLKNAKSMVYSWWTPPTQWSGKRTGAAVSVRLGFQNSLYSKIDYTISADIDTFLMHIRPVNSPYLVKGKLSDAASRGRDLYFNNPVLDCVKCHRGPLYTDMKLQVSGIPHWWDMLSKWDTPSLIETWRDGPWGHLGSFDRIEDMIRYKGHSTCMENGLSEEDLQDLVEFVLSL